MTRIQPPRGAPIDLETALAALLDGVTPVAPQAIPLAEARRRIAADMTALAAPLPARNAAVIDGWALPSLELAGASSYAPAPLGRPPRWIETGATLPDGCDCVLEPDLVEQSGPPAQALAEASPGQGVRRAGEDIAAGRPAALAGRALGPADLLVLRATGFSTAMVRSPRFNLIDVGASDGTGLTAAFIAALAGEGGANVTTVTAARDARSIAAAIGEADGDVIVTVGGTGRGRADHTLEAVAASATLIAHGLAIRPGETAALAKRGPLPVVALPGLPGHAFAAHLLVVQPLIDRLCGRLPRQGMALPLARKIASAIGVTEIALVRREADCWQVLAVGDLSLDHIRMADAWLAIGGNSEGFAAGHSVEAFPLRQS